MTHGQVAAYCLRSREPWREYFAYKPDDMPPRNGNPAKLAKLMAELGATDGEENEETI